MPDWEVARTKVLARLSKVRELVDDQDESGVLALINQQDAFCEAAKATRADVPGAENESHCHFCEGYIQAGGCSSRLERIDNAVLHGQWDEVRREIDDYETFVKSVKIDG